MKIWNTRYCLTDGITEHEAERFENSELVTIRKIGSGCDMHLHGEGKDWHRSLESAITRANEIKIKKLQSLDKQIKKISDIEF